MRISVAFAIAIAFVSLGETVRAQPQSLGGEPLRTARLAQAENVLPEYVPSPRPASEVLSGQTYLVPDWLQGVTVEPANMGHDGEQWLNRFGDQIHSEVSPPSQVLVDPVPVGFRPWWERPVREPTAPALPVSIDQLIEGALQYSSYVRVVSSEPKIRRTVIVEEQAAFDWRGFLDSTYNDSNNPVGNILTTGTNEDRFKDRTWSSQVGVRQDNRLGGNVELSQRLGRQSNNSRFLLPNPQATTQLELRYTQPLFNGAGRAYNESRIVLAGIAAGTSSDQLISELQEHLIQVTEAYWELYRSRAEYFQRMRLLDAAQLALEILEGREKVDTVQRQVLRSRAAVASRRSEIARAQTSIRNAESRLRLLVNAPDLVQAGAREFAPIDVPLMAELPVAMDAMMYTALHNRSDISRAIREVHGASVRLGVARNEVLPQLDLVASTYVAGLAAHADVGDSLVHQFDEGRPSFSTGLVFETPFWKRSANAQQARRQLEMQRAFNQFRLAVEQSLTSVELAVREVDTSYREMAGKYYSLLAISEEANYLFDRWKTLPGADDSAVLLLENLLESQERVADEEAALVRAQIGYTLSIVRLKQETGTLLIATPYSIPSPTVANDAP